MNDSASLDFAAIAYHAPSMVRPAFALPLISRVPGGNALYCQEDDGSGLVKEFIPLEHDLSSYALPEPCAVKVGSQLIFVVLGSRGEVLAGTREEIASVVSKWAAEVPYLLTRMSFLEFAGENLKARRVASSMFRERVKAVGEAQARSWFAEAVILPRVVRLASKASFTDRIGISIWLDRAQVNLSLPDRLLRSINQAETDEHEDGLQYVRALARDAFGLGLELSSSRNPPAGKVSEQEIITRRFVDAARYVESLPRQEERIAQLLSYVCASPGSATEIVRLVKPRAALERNALSLINEIGPELRESNSRDIYIERLIHQLYRSGYPMRRGELLFEIASRVRNIGAERALRKLVDNTSSFDLARYRSAILAVLGD